MVSIFCAYPKRIYICGGVSKTYLNQYETYPKRIYIVPVSKIDRIQMKRWRTSAAESQSGAADLDTNVFKFIGKNTTLI